MLVIFRLFLGFYDKATILKNYTLYEIHMTSVIEYGEGGSRIMLQVFANRWSHIRRYSDG